MVIKSKGHIWKINKHSHQYESSTKHKIVALFGKMQNNPINIITYQNRYSYNIGNPIHGKHIPITMVEMNEKIFDVSNTPNFEPI